MDSPIHPEWTAYFDRAYPKGASQIQRRETEQAFISGALATIVKLDEIASSTLDEDLAAKKLHDLVVGLSDWCRLRAAQLRQPQPQKS